MLRKGARLRPGMDEECADSGAETAESDCSKMSSASSDFIVVQSRDVLLMTMHLLSNPGESFLLQQTLDSLLKWVSPGLHLFHVSERAAPVKDLERHHRKKGPVYPSLSVVLFLHEDYGEERILQVQDFFQHPPWQYHHSESSGGKILPYLLSSQDFYSLDSSMPVWAVRPVHYGSEILRVTLYSSYDNFEDTVRLYETILQKEAASQKSGFCCFTLHSDQTVSVQLALKQLSLGVSVDLKESAVLQFRVREIGQLVPLLPNPCVPISSTRWQTEDYDGNKILFQVNVPLPPQHKMNSAFEVNCQQSSRNLLRNTLPCTQTVPPNKWMPSSKERGVSSARAEQRPGRSPVGQQKAGLGGLSPKNESQCSDSCCSTPKSSSCYSSQRSSPATLSRCDLSYEGSNTPPAHSHGDPAEQEQAETNVDTGFAVLNLGAPDSHGKRIFNGLRKDLFNSLLDTRTPNCASAEHISKRLPLSAPLSNSSIQKSSALGFKREGWEIPEHCLPPLQTKPQNVQEDEFFI
ncbi:protein FAM124B isoform X1 [Amia ocellicauda]|uniref:protein FAM124B isoform X1 n=1 Tax=Amia ocellicauda TaxID=2972642 RepID=UPI003464D29A